MITYNDKYVTNMKYGNRQVNKLYKGDQLVWSNVLDPLRKYDIGDLIVVDRTTLKKSIIRQLEIISIYNNNDEEQIFDFFIKYEIIGVIVVPAKYNMYGTGELVACSLQSMSEKTPEKGAEIDDKLHTFYDTDDRPKLFVNKSAITTIDNPSICIYESLEDFKNKNHSIVSEFEYDNMICGLPMSNDYLGYTYDKSIDAYLEFPGYCPNFDKDDNNINVKVDNSFNNSKGYDNTLKLKEFMISKGIDLDNGEIYSKKYLEENNIDYYYPLIHISHKFHTLGTNMGDWYIGSMQEYACYSQRIEKINLTYKYICYLRTVILNSIWREVSEDKVELARKYLKDLYYVKDTEENVIVLGQTSDIYNVTKNNETRSCTFSVIYGGILYVVDTNNIWNQGNRAFIRL